MINLNCSRCDGLSNSLSPTQILEILVGPLVPGRDIRQGPWWCPYVPQMINRVDLNIL